MKRYLVLVSLVLVSVFLLVMPTSAAEQKVYLRDYDNTAYQQMVAFYVNAGWSPSDAILAAGRITVDGVLPGDVYASTPTPTPTATPTPLPTATPIPEGYLEQYDNAAYYELVNWYIDNGFTVEQALEAASKVKVE